MFQKMSNSGNLFAVVRRNAGSNNSDIVQCRRYFPTLDSLENIFIRGRRNFGSTSGKDIFRRIQRRQTAGLGKTVIITVDISSKDFYSTSFFLKVSLQRTCADYIYFQYCFLAETFVITAFERIDFSHPKIPS